MPRYQVGPGGGGSQGSGMPFEGGDPSSFLIRAGSAMIVRLDPSSSMQGAALRAGLPHWASAGICVSNSRVLRPGVFALPCGGGGGGGNEGGGSGGEGRGGLFCS